MIVLVNARKSPMIVEHEEVVIPSGSPYVLRLSEVPVEGSVSITRITQPVKSGTGYGSMTSGGKFVGTEAKSYLIVIDGEGDIGTATFKWSTDGGSTWTGEGIPIEDAEPFPLDLGVEITPANGVSSPAFALSDQFSFDAECWTEVTAKPTNSGEYQLDYVSGDLIFASVDSAKVVYADYSGRGSFVASAPIDDLIGHFNAGKVVIGGLDTSSFAIGDVVSLHASNGNIVVEQASPVLGSWKAPVCLVKKVDSEIGEVIRAGFLSGLSDIVIGTVYHCNSEGHLDINGIAATIGCFGVGTDTVFIPPRQPEMWGNWT